VKALRVTQTSEHSLELVIDEGRYHQVRRMLAAVGNRVDQLTRTQVGNLILPADLIAGQWVGVDENMIGID
jgi:16S rRNA pseudouridine516 synthase